MVRKLTLTLSLAFSLAIAGQASAGPVTPVDLDAFTLGTPLSPVLLDDFSVSGGGNNGDLTSRVFFDAGTSKYVYTQTIFPTNDVNLMFNTEFDIIGFTGEAGWRFADSGAAGATGSASDFHIEETASGRLVWVSLLGGAFGEWNAFEPITFFFASTQPPAIKNYSLVSLLPVEFGTASGLAPVPEPGSIALFGSGLVGLYAAFRRRRSLNM